MTGDHDGRVSAGLCFREPLWRRVLKWGGVSHGGDFPSIRKVIKTRKGHTEGEAEAPSMPEEEYFTVPRIYFPIPERSLISSSFRLIAPWGGSP